MGRKFFACFDCCDAIVDAGGEWLRDVMIEPGQPCEVHPHDFRLQATRVALLPADVEQLPHPLRDPAQVLTDGQTFAPDPAPWDEGAPPPARLGGPLGPETEIAARLLVAWANEAEPPGDTIGRAVHFARMLLMQTENR